MTAIITTKNEQRLTAQIAIGFFLLAAFLGALMRYIYLREVPFLDYRHVMHAHSHIAMLGWGFTGLVGAIVFLLLPKFSAGKAYRNILYGNFIAGIGMFFSFLYQGYGLLSIAFCTLHVLVAYYFAWHFLKETKKLPKNNTVKFSNWAVYWMLFSTLGLWAIAPVSSILGKMHPLYFASIQFFLHFQFNGWFTFGILALLFKYSENNGQEVQLPKYSFEVLQSSLILTYFLSITWSTPKDFLFYLNSIGVTLQIIAFSLLALGFYRSAAFTLSRKSISDWLLQLGILSLVIKVIVQGAVALPFIAKVSYTIRNFVIGFIHLIMLGAFSLSLIAILLKHNIIPKNVLASTGYRLLAIGFVFTEALLFLQGTLLWAERGFIANYHLIIFAATLLLPIALLFVFIASLQKEGTYSLNL